MFYQSLRHITKWITTDKTISTTPNISWNEAMHSSNLQLTLQGFCWCFQQVSPATTCPPVSCHVRFVSQVAVNISTCWEVTKCMSNEGNAVLNPMQFYDHKFHRRVIGKINIISKFTNSFQVWESSDAFYPFKPELNHALCINLLNSTQNFKNLVKLVHNEIKHETLIR